MPKKTAGILTAVLLLGVVVSVLKPAEIPVYVTRMDDLAEYENDRLDHPKLYEVYGRECGFYQEEGLYVTKADADAKRTDPIIQRALQQAKVYQEHGCAIEAIDIVLPSQKQPDEGKGCTENYYLDNSVYWGSESGQDFRYFYITFVLTPIEHDLLAEVDAEHWSELLPKNIVYRFREQTTAGEKDISHRALAVADIWGQDKQAAQAQIGDQDELRITGTLYLKTKQIVLEDTLDKCKDHTYCPWGAISEVQGDQKADITCSRIETGIPHKYDIQAFDQAFSVRRFAEGHNDVEKVFALTAQYYQQPGKLEYKALLMPESIELL